MVSLARALAAAACLLVLALPTAAHAALDLSVAGSSSSETVGNGDDVVGPGDKIRVDVSLLSGTALKGATGTLTTATPGVTLVGSTADFSDASPGQQTANVTPFEVLLAADVPCGANISFALTVEDEAGEADAVTFKVPTGTRGPFKPLAGAAQAIAPGATSNVTLDVVDTGRVKGMRVKIDELSHPRLSDLRLSLIAPDGRRTVLADAGSLDGTLMDDTVFSDAASTPITGADAPFTGSFAPVESLGDLEARVLNGTWTLRIEDTGTGAGGTLAGWGLEAAKAYCFGIPKAAFSMAPGSVTPGGTVQFDGALSSDGGGGTIVGYEWDLDGDGQFDDGTTPQVQRTYPLKGSYSVRLRVTDNDGLTDIHLRRLPVTTVPTAALTATPTDPLTGDTFRLDAAGSTDADGTVVRYQWDVDGDGAFERDTQGVSFLDTSIPTPGNVTVRVLVTDEDGAQDDAAVAMAVRNRPPVAAITPPVGVLKDRAVTLSAADSTDPDGSVVLYEWDLDGVAGYETDSGTQPTIEHSFPTAGSRTIAVRVTDDAGVTATSTRTFTVTHAPTVVATATPSPVSLRRPVTIDASGSFDPDGPAALTYAWDADDDADDDFTPGGPTLTTSWPTAGTRTVKVRVTEPGGAATVGTVSILVRNVLPVATLAASPTAPLVGQATQLTASGTDGDGTVTGYEWDLDGDGSYEKSTGTTPTASATFANPGNVTVGVRVTDDDGGTGTKTIVLGVQRAPAQAGEQPPPQDPGTGTPPPGGDGTPTQPSGDPDPGPGTPGDAARPFGAWLGGTAVQRTRNVLARGLLVSCRSELDVVCSVTVSLSAADARRLRLGRRAVRIGSTSWPVVGGQSARKRVRLSAKARRALRGRSVRVLVRASARAEDGRKVALTRVFLLRR